MYVVYLNDEVLFYPGDEDYCANAIKLKQTLGDAGELDLTIPSINPLYEKLMNRQGIISVKQDNIEIFSGETREIGLDYMNNKNLFVTGELSFLYDTIQPQMEYHNKTPRQMLEAFVNNHNALAGSGKQFVVGEVNVTDPNDSLYRYSNFETTYDCIKAKLTVPLGGFLKVRKENGIRYLDWLTAESYGKQCNQVIAFEENLLDYSQTLSSADLITAILPLGSKLEDPKVYNLQAYTDITSVNDGKNYLTLPEAVDRFGFVEKVVHWDDVTVPANLKTKAQAYLTDGQYENLVLNLTAVDLSSLNADYDSFEIGDTVHAVASYYGMDRWFPVSQKETDLLSASNNNLKLGFDSASEASITSAQANASAETDSKIEDSITLLQSAVNNATKMLTGANGGYKLSEFDENKHWIRDLYMDSPNVEDAQNILMINMNGIGFSTHGYLGPYNNAWTIDGNLVADFITTGQMSADRIRGGTLEIGGTGFAADGSLTILDRNGSVMATMNKDGINIIAGKIVAPEITGNISIECGDKFWAINVEDGDDYSIGLGHFEARNDNERGNMFGNQVHSDETELSLVASSGDIYCHDIYLAGSWMDGWPLVKTLKWLNDKIESHSSSSGGGSGGDNDGDSGEPLPDGPVGP